MGAYDLHESIAYYRQQGAPGDQQMLIALLRECQQEHGALTPEVLAAIAQAYALKESMLTALIRRVPSLRLAAVPNRLEMCMTCPKGRELRAFVETTWNVQPGQSCPAAGFSYHTVPCMKNCANGPSIRWNGTLYSRATKELLGKLIRGQ